MSPEKKNVPPQPPEAGAPAPQHSPRDLRFGKAGRSLRATAARGAIVNGGFLVGLSLLTTAKGLAVASLITTSEYGLWGFLAAVLSSLVWLKQVGIVDKFVQQDEEDQELAFQRAFTLELIATAGYLVLLLAAIPVLAYFFELNEIIAPGLVLAAGVPALALQAPIWIFLRRMEFLRLRILEAVGPVVSFVLTIALAIAGYGYWSLVIGLVVGNWCAAAAAMIANPNRVRLRLDRATAREYLEFSWPMLVAGISIVLMAQVPVLAATKLLGLAGVGAITLSALIPIYARQASDVVTQTMYPGVCAVKDRADLLLEVFTKSNRFGILCGAPLGASVALFAPALVEFVLGEKWEFAVGLLQVMGVLVAVNQFGFNWTAFYRALGRTKPVAIAHVVQAVAICGTTVPLMAIEGLTGFAIGMSIATAIYTIVKAYYLIKLFPTFSVVRHTGRALVPTLAGALTVLAVRALIPNDGGPEVAIAEVCLYSVTVVAATLAAEGALVREAIGYLRRSPRPEPSAA